MTAGLTDLDRPPGPDHAPGAPPAASDDWQRLSPRMLVIHPIRGVGQLAVPLVLAILGVQQGDRDLGWSVVPLVAAALVVPFSLLTWMTTRYRFTDQQLQRRSGVLSRKVVTAPLDRVRSVDVEASPLHRLLGLAKVQVGTGVDSTRIELDGLGRSQAEELRSWMLRRAGATADASGATVPQPGATSVVEATPAAPTGASTELARIDWGWLRFAPFSLSSLVIVAGAVGAIAQFGDDLPVDQTQVAQDAWAWVVARSLLVLVAVVTLLVTLGWVLLSTLNYVLVWWNLRVTREPGGSLRITRGLLTTQSQTLEREKIRGVRESEPFLLRLVRGAQLTASATGVGAGGTVQVLPPAPRDVVERVGHDLLEEDGPLTMTLIGHGPAARRRIHLNRQWGTLVLAALCAVPLLLPDDWWMVNGWPRWAPVAALVGLGLLNAVLAEAAWRHLGHALTPRHLIVQSGALVRSREVLQTAGIIGWSLEQTFFQRRRGLAHLVATTAVGSERLVVPDIPVVLAVPLARRATPRVLEPFVR